MGEKPELPEDLPTGRRAGMSEDMPDLEAEQSLPHGYKQVLRDAIANFDRYAIQQVRDIVHRARSSRSESSKRRKRQSLTGDDSSGFE